MTMAQLHAFLEVVRQKSISLAAERLYMTQPTLSRQISTLEEELGVQLFTRTNNALSLTMVGEFFYHHAASLCQDYDRLVQETRDMAAGIRGTLHIALLEDQMLDEKLAEALHRLLQKRPEISVEVERGTYRDILEKLDQKMVDACQSTIGSRASAPDYHLLPLTTEPICLAFNQNYIQVPQERIHSREIAGLIHPYSLIIASLDAFPDPIRHSLPNVDEQTVPVRHVSAFSSTEIHLMAGTAATIGNQHGLIHASPNIRMVPIMDYPPMTQGLIYLKTNTNPLLAALLHEI